MADTDKVDTRKHYVVPMEITLKVEDEAEATALANAIAAFLPEGIKGVSRYFAPTVGTPQVRDTSCKPLDATEVDALGDLEASLNADPEGEQDA
jgi:hypothetical protein